MDPRQRVQDYLRGAEADRPPFLVLATDYTANMAQLTVEEMVADPNLFVRSIQESMAVCGFDAFLFEIRPEWAAAVAGGSEPSRQEMLASLREDLQRLRATVQSGIALVPLLPGPVTLCAMRGVAPTGEELDEVVTCLVRLHAFLDPPGLDAVAIVERTPLDHGEAIKLSDALATLWNVARYYSVPSLLVAAHGPAELGEAGAAAVAVWSGATPQDLLEAGAETVGVPVAVPDALPPLPSSAFYISAGEIPSGWPVDTVRAVVRRTGEPARSG